MDKQSFDCKYHSSIASRGKNDLDKLQMTVTVGKKQNIETKNEQKLKWKNDHM